MSCRWSGIAELDDITEWLVWFLTVAHYACYTTQINLCIFHDILQDVREELIYYDRPDTEGPKCSDYVKVNGESGNLRC